MHWYEHVISSMDRNINRLTHKIYIAKQLCVGGGRCSDICAVVDFEEKCFCPVGFNLTTPTVCTGDSKLKKLLLSIS